jgi:hypothetical protein
VDEACRRLSVDDQGMHGFRGTSAQERYRALRSEGLTDRGPEMPRARPGARTDRGNLCLRGKESGPMIWRLSTNIVEHRLPAADAVMGSQPTSLTADPRSAQPGLSRARGKEVS